MARHLIENSTTGDLLVVRTAALPFFPGWVVRDEDDARALREVVLVEVIVAVDPMREQVRIADADGVAGILIILRRNRAAVTPAGAFADPRGAATRSPNAHAGGMRGRRRSG